MRILMAVLLLVVSCAGCIPEEPEMTHLNVFIFAGQSNMQGADGICDGTGLTSRCASGQGTLDLNGLGTQQAADTATLFCLDSSTDADIYGWGDIRGHAGTTYGEATNLGGVAIRQHGPEVGFARRMTALGMSDIAIIKFAANYPALESGHSAWVSPGTRWTSWVGYIDSRLAELTALGYTYTIRGYVWHQGIDDALLHQSQSAYETDLAQIIADIRARYGAAPFVLARSVNSTIAGTTYMAPIRYGQVAVAQRESMTAWVTVDDATLVNTHHMSAASHLVIGGRFADEMDALFPLPEPTYSDADLHAFLAYATLRDGDLYASDGYVEPEPEFASYADADLYAALFGATWADGDMYAAVRGRRRRPALVESGGATTWR